MKRKSSNYAAITIFGVLVVGASLAAGYFLTGGHAASSAATPLPPAAPVASPTETAPNPAPVQPREVASAGKYTAPGAPSVVINELKTLPVPEKAVPDTESSQTGVDDSQAPADTAPAETPTVPPTTVPDDTGSGSGSQQPAPAGNAAPVAPTAVASNVPSPGTVLAPPSTISSTTGPLYCVEAGTFGNIKNAKSLIDNLRPLGFAPEAVPTDATNTSFRVQVGAFHAKSAADSAVVALQRQGYPAYILTK